MKTQVEKPVYVQVMDYIIYGIFQEKWKKGERIPSVRDLSEDLKINPNTVQKAFQYLEMEGVLENQGTLGKTVTENEEILEKTKQKVLQVPLRHFIKEMKSLQLPLDFVQEKLREEW